MSCRVTESEWIMRLCLLLACSICLAILPAGAIGQEKIGQTKLVGPGDVGDAVGFVVDAETGQYLKGAEVELAPPPNMRPIRGDRGKTGEGGSYAIKASLGTISHRLAADRLLVLSPLSILMGGANKTERFINVSQLNLHITCEGYKPFAGALRVTGANLLQNRVWLEPVWLAPAGQSYQSYTDPRGALGKIDAIELSKVSLTPGEKLQWRARASRLAILPGQHISMTCENILGFSMTRGNGRRTGDVYEFDGNMGMNDTDVGILHITHHPLRPGLYGLRFAIDPETPQFTPLAAIRFVAVGALPDKQAEITTALTQVNDQLAHPSSAPDAPDLIASLQHCRELLSNEPQAENRSVLALSATRFAAGDYAGAWAAYEPLVHMIKYEGLMTRIYKNAAAVQRDPGDFGARAALCQARESELSKTTDARLAQGSRFAALAFVRPDPTFMDALRVMKLPPMPTPNTPIDQLRAAEELIAEGDTSEAMGYLMPLTQDAKYGLQAQTTVAECYYRQQDTEKAIGAYEAILTVPDAKHIDSFYPFLHYGLLLLRGGQRQKAEEMLAASLQRARNARTDYSRPTGETTVPWGETYTVYYGGERGGAIGFQYPEAVQVQLVLTHFGSFDSPDRDWLSTATLGRALAELGLKEQAQALLDSVVKAHPDEQYALECSCTALRIAGDWAPLRQQVDRLLKLNPKSPIGLELAQRVSEQEAREAAAKAEEAAHDAAIQAQQAQGYKVADQTNEPDAAATPATALNDSPRVARISSTVVTLTVGTKEGLRVGDRVLVLLETKATASPVTRKNGETHSASQVLLRVQTVGAAAICIPFNSLEAAKFSRIRPNMAVKWWHPARLAPKKQPHH
jgi:tetratricopeptide (TPR) repeat protein